MLGPPARVDHLVDAIAADPKCVEPVGKLRRDRGFARSRIASDKDQASVT